MRVEPLLVTSIWVVSLILAALCAVRILNRVRFLAVSALFVLGSCVMVVSGFGVRYLQEGTPWWAAQGVLATSLGTLTVSLAALLGTELAPLRSAAGGTDQGITEPGQARSAGRIASDLRVGIVVFGLAATYFVLLGYVPVIEGVRRLLTGGFQPGLLNTLRTSRDAYITGAPGGVPFSGFFDIVRYFAVPTIGLTFLQHALNRDRRGLSWLMVAIAVLLITATGQRWPLLYATAGAVVVLTLKVRSVPGGASVRRAVPVAVVGLLVVLLLSGFLGRTQERLAGLAVVVLGASDLGRRFIFGAVEVPFRSYYVLQDSPLLGGATWVQNLAAYLPGDTPSYPVDFYRLVTGDPVGYTAPPDFYTEAFINGAWLLLVALCAIWGLVLARSDTVLARTQGRSELRVASVVVVGTTLAFSFQSGATFVFGSLLTFALVRGLSQIDRAVFVKR